MSENETSNPDEKIRHLTTEITKMVTSPVHIMVVCSGYQVTIQKYHLGRLLPEQIQLHYGPGCPVCLASPVFIDKLLEYGKRDNVIIATYADLLGIPGSVSTLEESRTAGADIRVVANIWDVLTLAKKNRRKRIVFPAVGFESAASSTAAAILQAKVAGIFNFHVLNNHKRVLAGMEAVLKQKEAAVDGFISSGRVAASMGADYFRLISEEHRKSQVISGYEPAEILEAILHLVKQINNETVILENLFTSAVTEKGNLKSHQLLEEVFEADDTTWTGFGKIKNSGFRIKNDYRMFDAEKVFFDAETATPVLPEGCLCGEIMRGLKSSHDCPLFSKICNPIHALGACMYSVEGPCRIEFLYGR